MNFKLIVNNLTQVKMRLQTLNFRDCLTQNHTRCKSQEFPQINHVHSSLSDLIEAQVFHNELQFQK